MAFTLTGTKVEMESTLGTNVTITAITKASEAVFTNSGTNGFTANDIVVVDNISGMNEMNKRAIRVKASPTTSSFTAEGLDSTGFSTYTSGGTANKVSAWVSFDNIQQFSMPDGNLNKIDVTAISDLTKKEIAGFEDAISATLTVFSDPMASHMVAVRAARAAGGDRAFRVTTRNGNVMIFNGEVAGGTGIDGSAGNVATSQVSVTVTGIPQWFAS
jgi:hypothetical protein